MGGAPGRVRVFSFFALDLAALLQPLPGRQGRGRRWSLPSSLPRRWSRWSGSARSPPSTSSTGRSASPAGCPRSPLVRPGSRHRHSRARRAWRARCCACRASPVPARAVERLRPELVPRRRGAPAVRLRGVARAVRPDRRREVGAGSERGRGHPHGSWSNLSFAFARSVLFIGGGENQQLVENRSSVEGKRRERHST